MTRRSAYAIAAAAVALPRLAVVLYEGGDITAAYVVKEDTFARTFLHSGTYGFIPGIPSAYTQPLYGFFLVPLYWIFGRSWPVIGLAQVLVAVGTALLVYEIGRRMLSPAAGLLAAVVSAVHPYLIWHDVHMNREILDGFLAAAVVLLALVAAERGSPWTAALLGAALGVAILGNVRLFFLPLVVAAWLAWRVRAIVPVVLVVLAAAVVVAPWAIRNDVSVGCWALTTDGRALWKANNPQTLSLLRSGHWIDDARPIPGAPPTPQEAGGIYAATGRIVRTDECAQMRFYQHRALQFMRHHAGTKLELAGVGTRMLWQPSVTKTEGRPGAGTWLDTGRDWAEPAYMVVLYALALLGLAVAPRRFTSLAVALLAYQTLAAAVFVGETRYRAPWDFLVAVLASGAALQLARRVAPAAWRERVSPAIK